MSVMSSDRDEGFLFAPLVEPDAAVGSASPAPLDHARRQRPREGRLRLCVLGSGSGGNCTVVQWGRKAMLLDAGFGPVTIAKRLAQAGMTFSDIRAICLTHLDQDHFRPRLIRTLLGYRILVFVHRWHLADLQRHPYADDLCEAGLVRIFDGSPFEPLPHLKMTPVRLPHDTKGTNGFLGESKGGRFGYATDLGCVPDELVERFAGVDLLALESNYDPPMQLKSNRPLFLKRRIMGQAGHLSNQQALETVQKIMERSPHDCLRHVVLLHRSAQCNTPEQVRETFAQAPHIADRVFLTEQRRRSRWFTIRPLNQTTRHQMRLSF